MRRSGGLDFDNFGMASAQLELETGDWEPVEVMVGEREKQEKAEKRGRTRDELSRLVSLGLFFRFEVPLCTVRYKKNKR